ncbi:MAG: ribosome maturation factor RimM [Defluviitaleaceae bacterium]|nr:ribosome maturation factor RimM [Defluviitaleaceae bacterium]
MVAIFEIGKITKAQGIRGEVRVFPTTDDPSRFELLIGKEIFVTGDIFQGPSVLSKPDSVFERGKKFTLTNARQQKNIVIVKFDGIDTRNAAEKLIGAVICVEDAQALPLGDDEFYVRDLIGLRAETESGEFLGEISSVFPTGANDVYVISGETEFMVPAVKDFVKKVSLAEGKIILRLADGMRELSIRGKL